MGHGADALDSGYSLLHLTDGDRRKRAVPRTWRYGADEGDEGTERGPRERPRSALRPLGGIRWSRPRHPGGESHTGTGATPFRPHAAAEPASSSAEMAPAFAVSALDGIDASRDGSRSTKEEK
jgi:hypothetical protein